MQTLDHISMPDSKLVDQAVQIEKPRFLRDSFLLFGVIVLCEEISAEIRKEAEFKPQYDL